MYKILLTSFVVAIISGCNLTVNKEGKGSVVSESGNIECGEVCTGKYDPKNVTEILTAEPAPGYRFVGWTGACKGVQSCGITISPATGNKTVTAVFEFVDEISLGGEHGCRLYGEEFSCSCDNSFGQIDVPENLSGIREVSAGFQHTCVLDQAGLSCWGDNQYGQLDIPEGLINPVSVSAGSVNTCVIDDNGVSCWGTYQDEDDGLDDPGQSNVPDGLINPVQVAAGGTYTCAIDDNGVTCWGGKVTLQDGGYVLIDISNVEIPELTNPTQVVAGVIHACALDETGVKCWGVGSPGFIEDGVNDFNVGQIDVPELQNPTAISAGGHHTCALEDRGVVCWGAGEDGLDEGPVPQETHRAQSTVPETVINPTAVAAGAFYTCALDENGWVGVICWGDVPDL